MTLDAAVQYKTQYIENLRKQSGAINRERIKYLTDELATMKATQAEIERLRNELESMKRKYLGLYELYETANTLENFYTQIIKTLSNHGKERSNNSASHRKPKPAGSANRQRASRESTAG